MGLARMEDCHLHDIASQEPIPRKMLTLIDEIGLCG